MNVTLTLEDDLVKEVRKIAVERDTTLTGLVRAYLKELAAENAKSGRKRRELEALEESFRKLQFNMEPRTWKREDLHDRPGDVKRYGHGSRPSSKQGSKQGSKP